MDQSVCSELRRSLSSALLMPLDRLHRSIESMAMMLVCVVFLLCAALILAKDHPTLPTQWVAETIEPGIGHVMESYNFVANPSNDQPSSMWTNYTGCERLIHVTSGNGGERYLLGCESLTCCKEPQQGNQVEFQIYL